MNFDVRRDREEGVLRGMGGEKGRRESRILILDVLG